jgi:hypothetical protein
MADPLFLSLWFPSFGADEMLLRAHAVLKHFPFSTRIPGITYLSLHPMDWNQATILEQRFRPGISPEPAIVVAADLLHEDYAYLFEAFWDLWTPKTTGREWDLQPSLVKFVVHGLEFDGGTYEQEGHIQVDFGPDSPFLPEGAHLAAEAEAGIRANVQKLVEFTTQVEKTSGASGRLLWSESEENLAQKLIARLQRVQ